MQLLPRDLKFFDQFLSQSSIIVEAAGLLDTGIQAGTAQLGAIALEIRSLERKGDEIEHEVHKRLHLTFITPIDPEDIHAVTSALDDILDQIESTAYRLAAYGLNEIPKPMQSLSNLLMEGASIIHTAFQALNETALENKEYISERCVQINRIETQAEATTREAITELFAREKDPVALMKLKEIYDHFEAIGDCMENLANVLENVIAKNS